MTAPTDTTDCREKAERLADTCRALWDAQCKQHAATEEYARHGVAYGPLVAMRDALTEYEAAYAAGRASQEQPATEVAYPDDLLQEACDFITDRASSKYGYDLANRLHEAVENHALRQRETSVRGEG